MEHIQLSVAQLQGGATAKTAPPSSFSASKQIKDDLSGLYQDLIVNTIAKLNASLKRPLRPYVSVQMNGQKMFALYDTGANICCMSSTAFRRVFPVGECPMAGETQPDEQRECGVRQQTRGRGHLHSFHGNQQKKVPIPGSHLWEPE